MIELPFEIDGRHKGLNRHTEMKAKRPALLMNLRVREVYRNYGRRCFNGGSGYSKIFNALIRGTEITNASEYDQPQCDCEYSATVTKIQGNGSANAPLLLGV